jgi:fibronectin-binding autotransporter adhesin
LNTNFSASEQPVSNRAFLVLTLVFLAIACAIAKADPVLREDFDAANEACYDFGSRDIYTAESFLHGGPCWFSDLLDRDGFSFFARSAIFRDDALAHNTSPTIATSDTAANSGAPIDDPGVHYTPFDLSLVSGNYVSPSFDTNKTVSTATAADDINGTGWKGTGGNQDWTTSGNWDSTRPADGERALFFGNAWKTAGSTGFTRAFNNQTGYAGFSITFQDNGGGNPTFTLDGNAITLFSFGTPAQNPFITNNSFVDQHINMNVTFNSSTGSAFISDNQGNLFFGTTSADGQITVSTGTTLTLNGGSTGQTTNILGNVTDSGAISITATNVNFSNGISGSGSLSDSSSGPVTLNGATTYTGATSVSAGTLKINNDNSTNFGKIGNSSLITVSGGTLQLTGSASVTDRIGDTVGVTVNTPGTFDLNAKSETIDALNGSGTVTNSTASSISTLTTGGNNGGGTFSGVLQNGSGTLALQKNGSGTLTLSGTSNTFTGGTTINGGTLAVSALGSIGGTTNTITLNNGAIFENTGSVTLGSGNKLLLTTAGSSTVTLLTDANLTTNSTTAIQNGASDLVINKSGVGILNLAAATSGAYLGNWQINAGSLSFSADSNLGNSGNKITLNGGTLNWSSSTNDYTSTRIITLNNVVGNTISTSNSSRTITLGTLNQLTSSGGVTFSGSGSLAITAGQNFSGGLTLGGGTLDINNAAALGTGTFTITTGTIDNTSGANITTSTNNNAQTWNGDFTFTGGTNHDLNLGTGAVSLGTVAGTTRTVTVSASNLTVGGVISNGTNGTTPTINLTKAGNGTLTLNSANTYTGATTINAGILSTNNLANGGVASGIGQSSATTSSNLTLNGGTLQYTGGATSTDRRFQIGANGATLDASGTGALVFTATTTNAFSYGSPSTSTRSLTLTGTNTGGNTLSGVLTDNVSAQTSLAKSGAGTWVLAGANTYTGATSVSGGTLLVNGSTASGSAVTVSGTGSTLGGTGTVNGTVGIGSAALLEGGTGSTGQTLTMKGAVSMGNGSVIELALGTTQTHSTLAIGTGGSIAFDSTQKFTFLETGAVTPGFYNNIITAVGADPGTEANWTFTSSLYAGTFSWDGANIDLTLTAVPEPSTWGAAALAAAVIGHRFSVIRRRKRAAAAAATA